jgi:hypothetical protein
MIYAGAIKDAYLLKITDLSGDVKFIYGTIVYDRTERFNKSDWIATNNLLKLRKGRSIPIIKSAMLNI